MLQDATNIKTKFNRLPQIQGYMDRCTSSQRKDLGRGTRPNLARGTNGERLKLDLKRSKHFKRGAKKLKSHQCPLKTGFIVSYI